MPQDNSERAIKKATGELEGTTYHELNYEGYGPAGVAVIVEVATDNKNRTVAEVRHFFSKNGGTLAETGSVAWMFVRKTLIDKKLTIENASLQWIAKNSIAVSSEDAEKVIKLIESLEDNDDVQNVYTNADFDLNSLK